MVYNTPYVFNASAKNIVSNLVFSLVHFSWMYILPSFNTGIIGVE